MNIRDAIAEVTTLLHSNNARRDAETLLLHLLRRDRTYLLAHPEDPVDPATHAQLLTLTRRRAAHEPLQYLTGHQEFFGLDLRVTPDTLIPRPETEFLVESVLTWVHALPATNQPLRIADIGTGTGAIAIALATNLPYAHLYALDISSAALAVAHENAVTHNVAHRITFLESDLLDALTHPHNAQQPFDVIVSNPPYIPLIDAPSLAPEVRDHEPHTALFAGPLGLDIYRRLIPQAHVHLRASGLLALEFGFGQSESLRTLLSTTPPTFIHIHFLDDYASIPRIALATRT